MTQTKDNGGPAFPNPALADENFCAPYDMSGMTLRDYAAIHADMSGFDFGSLETAAKFMGEDMPNLENTEAVFGLAMRARAKLRYMDADAIIAARKGGAE